MLVDYFGLPTHNTKSSMKNSAKSGLGSPGGTSAAMGSPHGSFSSKYASEKDGGNGVTANGNTPCKTFMLSFSSTRYDRYPLLTI